MTQTQPADFDRLLLTLDAAARMRRDTEALDEQLGAQAQEQALIARARDVYTSQGLPVDEDILKAAVIESRSKRPTLEYQGAPAGVLSNVYLKRDTWLKPARYITLGLALAWGGVTAVGAMHDASLRSDRADLVQIVASQTQAQNALVAKLPAALTSSPSPAASADLQNTAREWNQHLTQLGNMVQAISSRSPDGSQIQAAEEMRDLVAEDATKAGNSLNTVLHLTQAQATLAKQTPPQSDWRELVASWNSEKIQAKTAIDRGQLQNARTHLSNMEGMQQAGAQRVVLQELASTYPASMSAEAKTLLTQGDAMLLRGEIGAVGQLADNARSEMAALQQSYSLRIINREDQKSGVWRYPNNNESAKNYYLVVEAVDPSGKVLTLPILNEETQKTEQASLFAVRVPESEYEKVKEDKMDNGLIDNDIIGKKDAGERAPKFTVDVAGGYITNW